MLNNNLTPTKTLQLIFKKIKPKSHFLDLGFGQGKDVLFMAKNKFNVTAVEKSESLVKQIKEDIKKDNLNNIKVTQSNALDFKIEKNKYDIINCNNVLPFLKKDKALGLIKNIQKKIKKNGFILLSAFTTDDPSYKSKDKFLTYFKPQEILKLFNDFKIIYYLENVILDNGHLSDPEPHKHGVVKIIVQN